MQVPDFFKKPWVIALTVASTLVSLLINISDIDQIITAEERGPIMSFIIEVINFLLRIIGSDYAVGLLIGLSIVPLYLAVYKIIYSLKNYQQNSSKLPFMDKNKGNIRPNNREDINIWLDVKSHVEIPRLITYEGIYFLEPYYSNNSNAVNFYWTHSPSEEPIQKKFNIDGFADLSTHKCSIKNHSDKFLHDVSMNANVIHKVYIEEKYTHTQNGGGRYFSPGHELSSNKVYMSFSGTPLPPGGELVFWVYNPSDYYIEILFDEYVSAKVGSNDEYEKIKLIFDKHERKITCSPYIGE